MVEIPDFVHVAKTFLSKGSKEDAALFVRIARRLWFRWNDLVFNGKFARPTKIIKVAQQAHDDYLTINKKETQGAGGEATSSNAKWVALAPTWHKTNWDAALINGRVGVGIVTHDHRWWLVAARCFSIVGNLGPIAAEALKAYHATALSAKVGVHNLILEKDAKTMVQAVN